MAVMEFDIYAADDPTGTPLGTITDEDAIDLEFEVHWRKAGTGNIVINRHHAKAGLLQPGRYVQCRVTPVDDGRELFGFWLRKGRVILSHANGPGAETLQIGGPGTRDILRYARLLQNTYAPVPPASAQRGSSTVSYLWRWLNQHRGAIAARVMEEGINQELGDLLAPLYACTFDWDRTNDSNGVAWADDIAEIEQRIGISADEFLSMLEQAGGFILTAEPSLLFHAYQEYPFRDLTDSVTFQAGTGGSVDPNVVTEPGQAAMVRDLDSMESWTAMLVESTVDNGGDEVTDGGYWEVATTETSEDGPARIGYITSPVDDTTYMEQLAASAMAYSQAGVKRLALEVDPDQLLPGFENTFNGDYWLYDLVHVQSNDGNGAWDINEDKHVSAIRVGLRSATSDSSSSRARRSLRTRVLLDDDPIFIDSGGETPDT